MLKRRLNKNQQRAIGSQHPNSSISNSNNNDNTSWDGSTSGGTKKATATATATTPPGVVVASSPATHSTLAVLNRRVYPNGCLKKTTSVPTLSEELLPVSSTSYHETIIMTNATLLNTKTTPTLSVSSSNASVHTTSSTKSTSPPPPPAPPVPPMVTSSSSATTTKAHPTLQKKSVSFQEVYIREFERILGDNPSCSSGAPISLGWNYAMDKSLPIDVYEERQSQYARRTRSSHRGGAPDELILSRHDRETLLIEWGVTFNEMIDAIRTNVKIKNQRRRTVTAIGTYDRIEEIMENTASKLKGKLKLKKNSTGNGTVVAGHNHGSAVITATKTATSSSKQSRTLLHSNQLRSAHQKNATIRTTRFGRGNDIHSIQSNNSSDNSSSSAFGGSGSDRLSHSTTTSTSNVAVCLENERPNHRETDKESVGAISEVNDFSTNIRTPVSSIIDTNDSKNKSTTANKNTDDSDSNPAETVENNNNNNNNNDRNDENKKSSTLYDLDVEIEIALAAVGTEKKQQNKHRSSSFDDRRHSTNNDESAIKSRRPLLGATNKVELQPIIGVDIPRDVKLQRSMSVESGLTYDPHLFIAEDSYNYGTVQIDDDISTLAFDTEIEITEDPDVTAQEEADHEPTDHTDDVTVPSKFLREFNELMMEDGHPTLLNKSKKDAPAVDAGHSSTSNLAWAQLSDTHQHNIPQLDTKTETLRDNTLMHTLPINHPPYNPPTPLPQANNTFETMGRHDHDNNYVDYNTAKSLMTEAEYDEIYLQFADHPLSPISELTGADRFQNSFNSKSTASSYMYRKRHPEDGDFDKLQRDSSFWGICPGEHDAPQIQRRMMPVVITEDLSVGEAAMNHFEKRPDEYYDFRYSMENDIYASANYPDMIYPNHTMPSTQTFPQHIGNMALPPQYPLPPPVLQPFNSAISGLPTPNAMHPPHLGWIQQMQHDNSINTGVIHHHSYNNAPYPPPPLLVPTPAYPTMEPSTMELFVPPELLYNIENGQRVYANNHHQQHPIAMDNDESESVDVANTQQWDEYGFRLEPPPNSTTLLHKMMM